MFVYCYEIYIFYLLWCEIKHQSITWFIGLCFYVCVSNKCAAPNKRAAWTFFEIQIPWGLEIRSTRRKYFDLVLYFNVQSSVLIPFFKKSKLQSFSSFYNLPLFTRSKTIMSLNIFSMFSWKIWFIATCPFQINILSFFDRSIYSIIVNCKYFIFTPIQIWGIFWTLNLLKRKITV